MEERITSLFQKYESKSDIINIVRKHYGVSGFKYIYQTYLTNLFYYLLERLIC